MALQIFSTPGPLPVHAKDAHKGTRGRVLIVGGSRGMSGAPCLSARGAYRAGAGLVRVAVPKTIWDIVAIKLDECTTLGWPASVTGVFTAAFGDKKYLLKEHLEHDVIAMGMGLSSAPETAKGVKAALDRIEKPLLLDADALNAYKGELPELAKAIKAQARRVVLTPHPGEMARLMDASTKEIQSNRLDYARECAEKTGAVVVLKGAGTLVIDGQHPDVVYKNVTGNAGMGKGGTGDVLSGIIAGLIAQGLAPFEAACLGVHLHGLAGDLAANALGEHSMLAGDLLEYLPPAMLQYAG